MNFKLGELQKDNKYLEEKNEALQIKYDTLEAENKKLEKKWSTTNNVLEVENAKLRVRVKILD